MSKYPSASPHSDPVETKETEDERSEATGSGGTEGSECGPRSALTPVFIADPEVPEKARRRRFSAKYKLRIIQEADNCKEHGQLGELLRREGLYSSHLTTWRRQREEGSLQALKPRKRGRKAQPKNPLAKRVAELEKENQVLLKRIEHAELIIDVQKKVSKILGVTLKTPGNDELDS